MLMEENPILLIQTSSIFAVASYVFECSWSSYLFCITWLHNKYLAPQPKMIAPLVSIESFLEYIVNPFFFWPLEIPATYLDLPPFSILQCFEHTIMKWCFEGDIRTAIYLIVTNGSYRIFWGSFFLFTQTFFLYLNYNKK